MPTDAEWVSRLTALHDQELPRLRELNEHYEGTQPLAYMHPQLMRELDGQVEQVVINWPRLVADAIEERLDIESFRLPDSTGQEDTATALTDELWRIWQANNLDEESQQGHVDALVMRRSYVTVGANETDPATPRIVVESPFDMHAVIDPRTRTVAAALKRWSTEAVEDPASKATMATLYLPDATATLRRTGDQWTTLTRDDHGLGVVPVVVLPNRPRRKNPLGVSELADVIPLSNAACKIATDMMVSANFHAIPRYYATGVADADFQDADGSPLTTWERVTGRVWTSEAAEARFGQFREADLSNYHATLNALARLVASLCGLPPHYLGFTDGNPASADAIRSSEARLVKRAERKQRAWGGAWEQVMRLAVRIATGSFDPRLAVLETVWRDPATPTVAQRADASTKLLAAGVITVRQAREDAGYTAAQITRMEHDDAQARRQAEAARPPAPPTEPGTGRPDTGATDEDRQLVGR